MKVNKNLTYKKAIILDQKRMEEFLLKIYGRETSISWRAKTLNDMSISFDNYQEIIEYENYGEDRIAELNCYGTKYSSGEHIDIEFNPTSFSFFNYGKTIECTITADNEKQVKDIELALIHFFDKVKAPYWY
jgi:hypothetical protein